MLEHPKHLAGYATEGVQLDSQSGTLCVQYGIERGCLSTMSALPWLAKLYAPAYNAQKTKANHVPWYGKIEEKCRVGLHPVLCHNHANSALF